MDFYPDSPNTSFLSSTLYVFAIQVSFVVPVLSFIIFELVYATNRVRILYFLILHEFL